MQQTLGRGGRSVCWSKTNEEAAESQEFTASIYHNWRPWDGGRMERCLSWLIFSTVAIRWRNFLCSCRSGDFTVLFLFIYCHIRIHSRIQDFRTEDTDPHQNFGTRILIPLRHTTGTWANLTTVLEGPYGTGTVHSEIEYQRTKHEKIVVITVFRIRIHIGSTKTEKS